MCEDDVEDGDKGANIFVAIEGLSLNTRSAHYRKAGPWMTALRRLHANQYSDGEIAELLTCLSDASILSIERGGDWVQKFVKPHLLHCGTDAQPWTARQVRYHRLNSFFPSLKANKQKHEAGLAGARSREYQRQHRWDHLLPAFDLRRAETDILTALRDVGPMTRPELCVALGREPRARLSSGSGSIWYMGRLIYMALIEVCGIVKAGHRAYRRWRLAPLAAPRIICA